MRKALIIMGTILALGCTSKQMVVDTSEFVTKAELEEAIEAHRYETVNVGDVLVEIEKHRDECLHACDSK